MPNSKELTYKEKIRKAKQLIKELHKLELPIAEINKIINETQPGIEMVIDSDLLEQNLVDEGRPRISKGGF